MKRKECDSSASSLVLTEFVIKMRQMKLKNSIVEKGIGSWNIMVFYTPSEFVENFTNVANNFLFDELYHMEPVDTECWLTFVE